MASRIPGMACPDLRRATQGPEEEEVGSLARAYARFAPNFAPGLVGNGAIRAENGPRTTSEAPLSGISRRPVQLTKLPNLVAGRPPNAVLPSGWMVGRWFSAAGEGAMTANESEKT